MKVFILQNPKVSNVYAAQISVFENGAVTLSVTSKYGNRMEGFKTVLAAKNVFGRHYGIERKVWNAEATLGS